MHKAKNMTDFADKAIFAGTIHPATGWYEWPALQWSDANGRIREWRIYVRLIHQGTKPQLTGIDWDTDLDDCQRIRSAYFKVGTKMPAGVVAQTWTEYGIRGGKVTRSSPTYVTQPVNIGRANERNCFQQALIATRTEWDKQQTGAKRATIVGTVTDDDEDDDNADTVPLSGFIAPMLAKDFKSGEKHLKFPLFVQPKLDGTRCIIRLKSTIDGENYKATAYTRNFKTYGSIDWILSAIAPTMMEFMNSSGDSDEHQGIRDEHQGIRDESIYLDGETYMHGKSLQEISGKSRDSAENRDLQFHMFDCFYPSRMDMPFNERYALLQEFHEALDKKTKKFVRIVPCYEVQDLQEATEYYTKFVKEKYEGAMLRNIDSPYQNKRSNDLVKLKPVFTAEYTCVGFTEGEKGKDKGAIIWICATETGKEFNVTPKNMTYEERKSLFRECTKDFRDFEGRDMIVEYQDISLDGVPLRAKALGFRTVDISV